MNKLTLVLLMIILLLSALGAEGESSFPGPDPEKKVDDTMLEILNGNLDNLFGIYAVKEYFSPPQQALYSDVGPETVVEIENDQGKRSIRMFANADSVHDHIAYEPIDDAYLKNFMLTMEVTVRDAWPKGQGGCFVGFTNYGVSAYHGRDGAQTVALVSDGMNTEIYAKTAIWMPGSIFRWRPAERRKRRSPSSISPGIPMSISTESTPGSCMTGRRAPSDCFTARCCSRRATPPTVPLTIWSSES